ncbi:MAG: hypothetical protein KAS40_01800 [Desulfobacterales bacterium]|nr:hypothetical protein [Desulfobacterales bacterium]
MDPIFNYLFWDGHCALQRC